MSFKDWSETANDNDDADATINWAEGQAPSTVNGSSRAMMAALRTGLGHVKHIKQWGADCGGTVDDTSAISTAITSCTTGDTLVLSGTPLITSTLTVNKRIKLEFTGSLGINSTSRPGSYLIKDSTLSGPALLFTAAGVEVQNGGIVCEAGNTGAGLVIRNNSCAARDFYVENAQTYGIHVDHASAGDNCNRFWLERCRSVDNDSHGFFIEGLAGGNANAGTMLQCHGSGNGGDGIKSTYGFWNTISGCTAETNTGWGINFDNGIDNTLIGGDYEGNTAGQIQVQSTERRLAIIQKNNSFAITDSGYYTRRLDRSFHKVGTFTPAIRGASGADVTATIVSISDSSATITAAGHGYSDGDTVYHDAFSNPNLRGAFVISNTTTDTFDITFRTDSSATTPTTASGLTVPVRKCGTYTVQVGRYVVNDGVCEFDIHLVSSSKTNITGSVTVVLPFDALTLSNYFSAVTIGYMAGVTATDNVGCLVSSGGRVALIYEDISGSPGTPSQLNATGLAAATTIVLSGRYLITQEN